MAVGDWSDLHWLASQTAVRVCSHATADVQIAQRYQLFCDRARSRMTAFVPLQPENLTVSMTVVCAENLIHID